MLLLYKTSAPSNNKSKSVSKRKKAQVIVALLVIQNTEKSKSLAVFSFYQ